MTAVGRWAAPLLEAGGVAMAAVLVVMTVVPDAPVLYAFLLIGPAIGLGVLAALAAAVGAIGRFGRTSAWLAATGGLGILAIGLYGIATDQFAASSVGSDADPLAVPLALTSTAWMLGSLGFAIGLERARWIPTVGARLLLVGTVSALVLGTLLGTVAPGLSALSAVPFALGWVVVGRDLGRAGPQAA